MLNQTLLNSVAEYAKQIQTPVTFALNTGDHSKREELRQFLTAIADTADTADTIEFIEEAQTHLRSPISFELRTNGQSSGIQFSGIPGGHEFNSLILALLHAGGHPMKLDPSLVHLIQAIDQPLHFVTYVSLSCHNCPDIVQLLNQCAVLNPNITSEMVDGQLFQSVIDEKNIQGVPTTHLNDEPFATGKIDPSTLINKLLERFPNLKDNATASTEAALGIQDMTIIGGGPAGVAAAIYGARKGLAVTLIADRIGGQVKDTQAIENFISIPLTHGPELSNQLRTHMNDYDITIKEHLSVETYDTPTSAGHPHRMTLNSGEVIESKTVIVATGARWRELNVPGEKENIGNGVAYCPHCDGPFFKGKKVAVVGGGNSGVEAAIDLSGIAEHVTVLEFLPELKADQVLVDKMHQTPNISVMTEVATQAIESDDSGVNGITIAHRATDETETLDLDGVFVQIGLLPNSGFIQEAVETNRFGEILVNDRCETNVSGLFACGDVTNIPYKQIIIAMGHGATAALSAFDYTIRHD